ncbi:MAG TPA: serine hydrolase [Chryseolinea sp.]|nr:serine hydrolase [Chryseolinea sp.]
MRHCTISFLFAPLLFIGHLCFAQPAQDGQLARDLDQLIAGRLADIAPGCAVLVTKKGRTVYKKGFGYANLELRVPTKPDMVFRIGSVTKQYTAIAILQLVEQGKIALRDSFQKFIPSFPYKGHTITIENLLTHTSGVVDYEVLDAHIPNAIRIEFPAKYVVDSLANYPLEFTPGAKYHYSNSNYFLLGQIIEAVSGKSYQEYLQENIFQKAGLKNTYYDSPTQLIPNRVNGYTKYDGVFQNAGYISMSLVYSAGALLSNTEDLYKWHQALYSYKLVKKETLEKAFTPFKLADGRLSEYGYGWFIRMRNNAQSIEHSGGIDGFQSDEIYFPEQDIFIATLYNSLNDGGNDLSFMALDNDICLLALGQKLKKAIQVDSKDLAEFVGVYESDPEHSATITLENGQLQFEASGGGVPKSPLFSKSENNFFLKIIDADIEFVRDKDRKVTELIVTFQGQKQVAKKVK